jgi:thymidylate synthase
MMSNEHQHLSLLKTLVNKADKDLSIRDDRTGTGTYGNFGVNLRHDMSLGLPIFTTKKVAFRPIVSELLWFMRGQTDLRTLVKDKNTIWVGDAYKRYLKFMSEENPSLAPLTEEQFIQEIIDNNEFSEKFGQLGPIYGGGWRGYDVKTNPELVSYLMDFPEVPSTFQIDQLNNVVEKLRTNPNDRRILVNAWKPESLSAMILPPCHMMFQFYVEQMSNQEKKRNPGYHQKLSLKWYQRSADSFLGSPFNCGSYGLLLEMIARMVPGTKADQLFGSFGDYHLYSNHIEQSKLQVSREPMPLPKIMFSDDIKFDGTLDEMLASITDHRRQIQLDGYMSHSAIHAPLSN